MPIGLTCSSCSKSLKLADKLAGKSIKCPQCATVLRVPGNTATTAPPAVAVAPPPPEPEEVDDNLKPAPGAATRKANAAASSNSKEAAASSRAVFDSSAVPEPLQTMVREELTKGEKLVWIGQPDPKLVLLKNLALASVAALVLLLMIGTAVRSLLTTTKVEKAQVVVLLIGVVGLPIAVAVPFFQRWKATKSCYAITSRRALVFDRNAIGAAQLTSYNPAELAGVRRREWWFFEEAGDVIFKTKIVISRTDYYDRRSGGYRGSNTSKSITYYGFLCIRQPRDVELLIRETLVDPILDKLNA